MLVYIDDREDEEFDDYEEQPYDYSENDNDSYFS